MNYYDEKYQLAEGEIPRPTDPEEGKMTDAILEASMEMRGTARAIGIDGFQALMMDAIIYHARRIARDSARLDDLEVAHEPGDTSLRDALDIIRTRLSALEAVTECQGQNISRRGDGIDEMGEDLDEHEARLNFLEASVTSQAEKNGEFRRHLKEFVIQSLKGAGVTPAGGCKGCDDKVDGAPTLPDLPEGRDPEARLSAAVGNLNKALLDSKRAGKTMLLQSIGTTMEGSETYRVIEFNTSRDPDPLPHGSGYADLLS